MIYFHVLVKLEGSPDKIRRLLSDLSHKELEESFLKPYRRGQRMLVGGAVIDTMAITFTRIVETTRLSEVELLEIQKKSLREIDEINRRSDSVTWLSIGRGHDPEDIQEAGPDVTARFINAPPGQDQASLLSGIYNHPLFLPTVSGLIVLGIAALFGL